MRLGLLEELQPLLNRQKEVMKCWNSVTNLHSFTNVDTRKPVTIEGKICVAGAFLLPLAVGAVMTYPVGDQEVS
jgi:hypothetical protein